MTDHDDAVAEASARVAALQVGLADLNANIDTVLSRKREMDALAHDVGGLRSYGQRSRTWIWVTVISLALNTVFTVVLWYSAHHADVASGEARHAVAAANIAQRDLCQATDRSWVTRQTLIYTLTKPTVLSPEVAKLFPSAQTESLRIQIGQANTIRAAQRKQLLADNGPRPVC